MLAVSDVILFGLCIPSIIGSLWCTKKAPRSPAAIHSHLLIALSYFLLTWAYVFEDRPYVAGLTLVLTAGFIYLWFLAGGNDDFKKRRKRWIAKAKNKLRKLAPVFKPRPLANPA